MLIKSHADSASGVGGRGGGLGMDSELHFIQPNISFNVLYPNVYTMMLCLQLLTITKCNVI